MENLKKQNIKEICSIADSMVSTTQGCVLSCEYPLRLQSLQRKRQRTSIETLEFLDLVWGDVCPSKLNQVLSLTPPKEKKIN